MHNTLALKTIRLTGGEPTLFKDLVALVAGLSKIGVEIKMTTNAYHLDGLITPLFEAGLKNINISLDATSEETFRKISNRKGLNKIIENIDACITAGYTVKLNTVVIKGINDHEIIDILDFAKTRGVSVRFLELMKMGHLFSNGFDKYFISENEVLKIIGSKNEFMKMNREANATANYYSLKNGYKFGVIANESDPFCGDCDRLRLDISGNIFGCLSENKPLNIAEYYQNNDFLLDNLQKALAQKQENYFVGSNLSMMAIGG